MELSIFKKMKVKPNCIAHVINPPKEYPKEGLDFEFKQNGNKFDFVHLFISNRKEFEELIESAKEKCNDAALFWVSYPKSNTKVKYDINRDSLWDMSISHELHPVAQIALNENWSAVRLLPHNSNDNEKYLRPVK